MSRPVAKVRGRRLFTSLEMLEARTLFAGDYTIVDLGAFGGDISFATDINDHGQVVGYSITSSGSNDGEAFLWDGSLHHLGFLGNGTDSAATSINNNGVIVGSAENGAASDSVAVQFSKANGIPSKLPALTGGDGRGGAAAINDGGVVVGNGQNAVHDIVATVGTLSTIEQVDSPAGASLNAADVNSSGVIAGTIYLSNGEQHPYYFDGTAHDLGTLSGFYAFGNAINDSNVVVGRSYLSTGLNYKAFKSENGGVVAIADLGGNSSEAKDINSAGMIVGQSNTTEGPLRAFMNVNGTATNLNDLLPAGSGWILTDATAINSLGQIVGTGFNADNKQHAFLLSPPGVDNTGGGGGDGGGETPTSANLTSAFKKVTLPSVFVPGDKGSVSLSVTNDGDATAAGAVSVSLYLSTDATYDDSDVPLDTGSALANKNVKISPTKSATLSASFVAPVDLNEGTYYLVAKLDASAITQSSTGDDNAVSATTYQFVHGFGTLGGRAKVALSASDEDGSTVTYQLTGPGSATVTSGIDGNPDITLTGTTVASKLTISAKGGDNLSVIHSITTDAPLGTLSLAKTSLTGNLSIAGDAKSITIAGIADDHLISIGGSTPVTLKLGIVSNTSLVSTAPIKSLAVTSWTDDNGDADIISAPSSGAVTSKGVFDARLALSGALKSLSVGGDLGGDIAATTIGDLVIKGSATGVYVMAGANFGADEGLGGGDDTFVAGTIKSIKVTGAVTSSVFAAGLRPFNDNAPDINNVMLMTGGSIKTAVFNGGLSDDSLVAGDTLPKTVKVSGVKITPSGDQRFLVNDVMAV